MNKFFDNEITCAAAVFLLGIDAFAILCAGFYSTFKVPMFAYCNMYMGTGISTEFTGVLMLSLFVLLAVIIRSVGHYRGNELAKNTVIDRIPIEIVYTVLGMAFFFFGWGVAEFSMQIYDMYVEAGFPRAAHNIVYHYGNRALSGFVVGTLFKTGKGILMIFFFRDYGKTSAPVFAALYTAGCNTANKQCPEQSR